MGKVMRHTLGASLNIRHNLSSSKGPKPLQLKLLTTYIPKTSAFTLAFSTSQRLRTTRASARTFFTFRHYITPSARKIGRASCREGLVVAARAVLEESKDSALSQPAGRAATGAADRAGAKPSDYFFFSSRRRHTRSVSAFLLNRSSDLPTYQRRAPLRLPLVPRNGCGRPGRAPERFLPLDITSLLLHVIFDARFLLRQ